MTKPPSKEQREAMVLALYNAKLRARTYGFWKTYHALDAAEGKLGWEIAEALKDEQARSGE